MSKPPGNRWPAAYLLSMIVAGAAAVLVSVRELVIAPVGLGWFVFAALTVLSGSATLRLPSVPVGFSISDTFTMTAALLFGPAAGTAAVALDSLAISLRLLRRPLPLRRLLFNATAPALAMWVAAHAFFRLANTGPLVQHPDAVATLLGPLAGFAAVYFLLNTGLIASAIALEQRARVMSIWRAHFLDLWLTYFGGAWIAALIIMLVYSSQRPSFQTFALVLPLPLILYFTFRSVVDRLQDHLTHLDTVNRMNLATIDALAQAIDAKDQVTHGHIQRVRLHAIRLAHELGITDEVEMRALEAAALLHDVGKLAVPEHILNKPARLTRAEYDQMKQHAEIGAQILSSIEFPYPVVPIVRHHHEFWDGNGYPSGLRGTNIPIGARILSVVDCFDALTSDRPYRPKLADEDALRVVQERRGTMYDPEIVDAFVRIYPLIAADVDAAQPRWAGFSIIADAAQAASAGGTSKTEDAEAGEASMIEAAWNVGMALGSDTNLTDTNLTDMCDRVRTLLERMMPASTCVLFLYDVSADRLAARSVSGRHADAIRGLTMGLGQRLTGWVAANRAAIVNSDAALDLVNLSPALEPPLRTCLSVPMVANGDIVGVVTVYSTETNAFTDRHQRLLEAIAAKLASHLTSGVSSRTGPARGSPD
ncbi:MAG: HD domain-containing protein [Acidobacteria bacterium]|nr:HD domain-containing protein [Acidobacteriota bacterium]